MDLIQLTVTDKRQASISRQRERRPEPKADNLSAICEPTVYKMWESRRLTILWTSEASYSDSFTFINNIIIIMNCIFLYFVFLLSWCSW
jgi:hypothetical protein